MITGTGSVVLAAWVIAGRMTREEADAVWLRLYGSPIPEKPSVAIAQVESTLAAVRETAA